MKPKRNLHMRLQEMCDCYATNDPLKEMSAINNGNDKNEAALKWLALAALHGVNDHAKKISIVKSADGHISVTAKYRESELPPPDNEIGKNILSVIREITHIDSDKGKMPLALGIRQDSIDLNIKIESEKGKEKVTLSFPDKL